MKVTTTQIEVAIMRANDIRQNVIVPNISNQMGIVPFEVDVLVIRKSGCAIGFEIKVTKSDLKKDLEKRQYRLLKEKGINHFFGKFKEFYYAVPMDLVDEALNQIEPFVGLVAYQKPTKENRYSYLVEIKPALKISDYKWSDKEIREVTRLGTMRILALKQKIVELQNNKK